MLTDLEAQLLQIIGRFNLELREPSSLQIYDELVKERNGVDLVAVSFYGALQRCVDKKALRVRFADPSKARAWRPKRFFCLTKEGLQLLHAHKEQKMLTAYRDRKALIEIAGYRLGLVTVDVRGERLRWFAVELFKPSKVCKQYRLFPSGFSKWAKT